MRSATVQRLATFCAAVTLSNRRGLSPRMLDLIRAYTA